MAEQKRAPGARARAEKLARMAIRELGRDPAALHIVIAFVELLAERSPKPRRAN